ncbi:GIY-YIG nuclease family protein [Paraburkholderia fungorum]|uniref:hypothetical protein n=1 Tax=Paraburkholderia fungorum TaxID=134537 RepID=UPI0038BCE616
MKDVSMHQVYEMALKWPTNLVSAADLSDQVGVSPEQLLSWANDGVCPHFKINNGIPLFRLADVRRWMIEAQVLQECLGVKSQDSFTLRVISDKPNVADLPIELRSVGKVFDVSNNLLPTGVYFLYLGGVLQYVGQSIEPATRLSQHRHSGKVFDRAFVIPMPAFMLDRVEGALIRHFRPPLNGNTAPRCDIPKEDVLSQLGIIEQILDDAQNAEAA